ncbi:MAG: dihydroxyacetone kinase subunit DhaK [Reyranella sp.]
MQFMNGTESLVVDAIDGLLRSSGGANLARLDGYPDIKVVLRTDHRPGRVAIVAGGGSGHEPAHASFVGKGMLTAAVCGEVFASPTVDAVFAAIMAVTGKGGCLVIIKNYTGDRLNFGLAVERARAHGKQVEVVIVKDDIALPHVSQPRGIAGVAIVEKIAGHYAEKGANLKTVAAMARKAAEDVVSLGISLSSCTLPGSGREERVPHGKAELGLGIHGEPGVDLVAFESARETARVLVDRLFAAVRPARSYALLANNLGSTTALEMNLLTNEVLASKRGAKIRLVLGPATLVSSLDMHGFSLSLLPLAHEFEQALRSPAGPLVWPPVRLHEKPKPVKLPRELKRRPVRASRNPTLEALVRRACDVLIAVEGKLNALDARVGDGDTGSTVATAARHLQAALPLMPLARPDRFFAAMSEALSRSMGGSSGVLLAIFFEAASQSASKGARWQESLASGLAAMMAHGGAKPGDRTMIDALAPGLRALPQGLDDAARAARAGADATARMPSARAGRSTHVPASHLEGVPDPGAEAVALLLEGLARA